MAHPPPLARPSRRTPGPVLWTALGLQVAIALLYFWPGVSEDLWGFVAELVTLPTLLAVTIAATAFRARRSTELLERRFWTLLTIGLALLFAVRIGIFFLPTTGILVTSIFTEPVYLGFYLLTILAIRVQPDYPATVRDDPVLARAETAGVYVFVIALLLYFVTIPALLTPDEVEAQGATQIQYALLDLIVGFGFAYSAIRARSRVWRERYLWLAGAFAFFLVTDLADALYYLTDGARGWIPWWLDHLYYLPYLLVVAAAERDSEPSHLPDPEAGDAAARALTTLVVFALIIPSFHFTLYTAGVLEPEIRDARGLVVLLALLGVMSLAWRYQQKVVELLGTAESRTAMAERERSLLAEAVEQSDERIAIVGPQMGIEYANPAFVQDSGISRRDLSGRSLLDFLKLVDPADDPLPTLLRGKPWAGRSTRLHDGLPEEESVNITPVTDLEGTVTHFVVARRDLSTEAVLEQRLRQSQKMESLGTLAGGVAHDFNNILSAIYGYLDLAVQDLEDDHAARDDLDAVFRATDRAKELVDQILRLSRRADVVWKNVDLASVLTELEDLTRASSPSSLTAAFDLAPDLPPVRGSASQLHQVFLNLITNAIQAAGADGRIEVTAGAELDAAGIEGVRVSIRDDGPGVPTEIADRIFDPFFTTKDVGEGTGLGLSVAHGIIASHNGTLELAPFTGRGAVFTAWLPASTIDEDASAEAAVNPALGSGRIYVVEDEPDLRTLLSRRLTSAGYSCEVFDSPPALLAGLGQGATPDLIVTDQTMPGMTGIELVRELRSRGVSTPVILVSGFAAGLDPDELARLQVGALIPKPFRTETLLLEIEKLLSDRPG